MNEPLLPGLVVATHSPFAADGSVALPVIERQASHLLAQGVTTVFVCGSTGESHSLTVDERLAIARRWAEVIRGTPLRLVVHVGSNCLQDARALAADAERLSAVAISALAPSYFKPRTVELLVACAAEIAAAAPRTPFYFYDIPALTGVSLSMPEFLAQAGSRIPTLRGLKFTHTDLLAYQLCLRADGGRYDVPFGNDEFLLAALALGARGAVGSSYAFAAPVYHRLLAAFARGDLAAARDEQFRSVQLIQRLAAIGYLGAAKAVMGMLGIPVGPARLPNGNPDAAAIAALRRDLEAMGFFEWIRR